MDEMTWTDPQLKALYERHLKAMEQRRAAHPELFNKWAVPYKVFTRSSLHGIQNMRINWLMDNHPQRFREMMMANVLEEHLRDIERRTRERQAQIMDRLMESRHLLNRTDCLKAAPQMTDLNRLNGMNEAQAESMSMATHEMVQSFSHPPTPTGGVRPATAPKRTSPPSGRSKRSMETATSRPPRSRRTRCADTRDGADARTHSPTSPNGPPWPPRSANCSTTTSTRRHAPPH